MKLTQRELFKATVEHQKVDGILYYADFVGEAEKKVREYYDIPQEKDLREIFNMFTPYFVSPKRETALPKADYSLYYEDIEIPVNADITDDGILHIPGSIYHFTKTVSPLRNATSLDDLEKFPWGFLNTNGLVTEHMSKEVEYAHSIGLTATCWIGRFYESAWYYRGYEEMLMDMISDEDMANFIFDKLYENNMFTAIAAAKAGVDFVMCGDDVANQNSMMFSLDTWRYYQKSRWSKIYAEVKKIKPDIKIWYHSDGKIWDIIPELIEIGVDILNPVQPECIDPYEVKKKYGKLITIDGAIGTQTVMPFGSPADVNKAVQDAIEILGADGGFILSPSHIIEPEVPIENIKAFIDTANKYNS
jgi:uroporphyrinogen decarboxylase